MCKSVSVVAVFSLELIWVLFMDKDQSEKLFADRYRRLYKLGQGGMGQVWKCHDVLLKKDVALKVLIKDESDTAKTRFQAEAKALAKLRHKNIVGILDFGVSDLGELYMVMDYVPGADLKSVIEKDGILDKEMVLTIISQICNGLNIAHGLNLIHRDIKPSNILMTVDDSGKSLVKIVDFGTVRFSNADQYATPDGIILGSPYYMSPEAVKGETVDERSDLYSLGCLLYECLTGTVPFKGENRQLTLIKHTRDNPPELKDLDDQFLKDIVYKCLKKNPEERFQSAREILDSLIDYYDTIDTEDFDLEGSQEKNDNARSFRWTFALIALTVSAYLGYVFFSVLFSSQELDTDFDVGKPVIMEDKALKMIDGKLKSKPTFTISDSGLIKCSRAVGDEDLSQYLATHQDTGKWNMSHCSITDNGIKLLDMSKLSFIELDSTVVTDKSLAVLAKAKKLNYLDLRHCGAITSKGFANFFNSDSISLLAFGSGVIDKSWIDTVVSMPRLESLTLNAPITSNCNDSFTRFINLKRLVVEDPSNEFISIILKLPSLNTLHVRGKLSSSSLKQISKSRLDILDLTKADLSGISPEIYFSKTNSLKNISLPSSVSNKTIEILNLNNPDVIFRRGKIKPLF